MAVLLLTQGTFVLMQKMKEMKGSHEWAVIKVLFPFAAGAVLSWDLIRNNIFAAILFFIAWVRTVRCGSRNCVQVFRIHYFTNLPVTAGRSIRC